MRQIYPWMVGAMVVGALAASRAGAVGSIVTDGATIAVGTSSNPGTITIDPAAGEATPPDLPAITSPGAAPQMSAALPGNPSYGNGSLGALSTSSNVALSAGTYQYASIQILPGGSITCTGAVTILTTGDFESYGPVSSDSALTIRAGGQFVFQATSPTNTLTTSSGSIEVTAAGVQVGSGHAVDRALIQSDTGNVLLQALEGGAQVSPPALGTFGGSVRAPQGSVTLIGAEGLIFGANDVLESGGGPLVVRSYGAYALQMNGIAQVQPGQPVTIEATGSLIVTGPITTSGSAGISLLSIAGPMQIASGAVVTTVDGDITARSAGDVNVVGSSDPRLVTSGVGDVHVVAGGTVRTGGSTIRSQLGQIDLVAGDDVQLGYNSIVRTETILGSVSCHAGDDVIIGDEGGIRAGGAITVRGGDFVNIGEARQDAKGPYRSASGGGDSRFTGTTADVSAGGRCRIDVYSDFPNGSINVLANGDIEISRRLTARNGISIVSRQGNVDISSATLRTDQVSEVTSGSINVDSYDPNAEMAATSSTLTSGDSDTASGDVSIRVFTFVPPVVPVQSYVLPKRVRVEVNEASPERTRLAASGFFDTGPDALDLSKPAIITVGTKQFAVSGFTQVGTKFFHNEEGLAVRMVPAKSGSSRCKFRLNTKGAALAGAFPRDGNVELAFDFGTVEGKGKVGLQGGNYVFGQKAGNLSEPNVFLVKAVAKLNGDGADSIQLVAGLATDGMVPAVAPDVTVNFGDAYAGTIGGSKFRKQGARYLSTGNPRAMLDYAREQILLVATGTTLGAFPEGPQAVTIRVGLGSDAREVRVRMVRIGNTLRY